MTLWVLSDLHLADRSVATMYSEERQGKTIERLCARIAAEGNGELILLGDVFDLTGMTAPKKGVASFGRKMGIALDDAPERSPSEMCAAARLQHPRTLAALAELSKHAKVTLVAGNHDWPLGTEVGSDAIAHAGLERATIETSIERTVAERRVVMQHGHELDDDNAAPGGSGEMLTRILHHAIVPMLERISTRPNIAIDPIRVVCLRPEERIVPVLQRWLSRKQFDTFVSALLDLMVETGSLSRVKAWLATPEKLREKLDDADDLWERIGSYARDVLKDAVGKSVTEIASSQASQAKSAPDVLVYGHTHVPDWAIEERAPGDALEGRQALYLNLGSWTDRATDAVGPFDRTLPIARITEDARGLRATLEDLESGDVLETFDAAHERGGASAGLP